MTGDFSGAWETLKNMVTTNLQLIWQTIVNIWGIITGFLSSTLNRIIGIFGTSWQQIFATVSSKVSQIWSKTTSVFSALVSAIAIYVGQWLAKIVKWCRMLNKVWEDF